MNKLRPSFKIHGGKNYLSSWTIENFPKGYESLDYLEPCVGAGSVFLNKIKPASNKEILNDLDPGVVAILRTLRDESEVFIKKLKKTTYSERVFNREKLKLEAGEFADEFEMAVSEFIVRRMSRGGMKKAFAWSDRKRGGQPGDVNAWQTIIEVLPAIAERLKDAFIFNKKASYVIKAFNYPNIICYVDPPYLPETRVSGEIYEFEMTTDDHIELAEALNGFKGKAILSGYPSTLYKRLYKEWTCVRKKVVNHSSQQKTKPKKVEVLWMNY